MPRLATSMRMSTQAELLSGVTILSLSLLMRAVAVVSPSDLLRDFLGVFSVLFLIAGFGVLGVGLAHRVARVEERESPGDNPGTMTADAAIAAGAVIGVGIGSTVGSLHGGAFFVVIGTAICASIGAALGSRWQQRQQRPR